MNTTILKIARLFEEAMQLPQSEERDKILIALGSDMATHIQVEHEMDKIISETH